MTKKATKYCMYIKRHGGLHKAEGCINKILENTFMQTYEKHHSYSKVHFVIGTRMRIIIQSGFSSNHCGCLSAS